MARLALSSIPDDLTLQDDNLLRNLDDRCIRSLGGILPSYPISKFVIHFLDMCQVPVLQTRYYASSPTSMFFVMPYDVSSYGLPVRALTRVLGLQASCFLFAGRAIYSNVNGFLGGVAWAMLVARICQLYPNAVAGAIVSRFFIIMYQWCVSRTWPWASHLTSIRSWPQPVLLKQIEDGPLQVRIWNPKVQRSALVLRVYSNPSSSCTLAIGHIECLSSHPHILPCVPPIMLLPQRRWL
jgi:poly(A) polymerase